MHARATCLPKDRQLAQSERASEREMVSPAAPQGAARARKSSTARLESPWATASSGSGMYRPEDVTCNRRNTQRYEGRRGETVGGEGEGASEG